MSVFRSMVRFTDRSLFELVQQLQRFQTFVFELIIEVLFGFAPVHTIAGGVSGSVPGKKLVDIDVTGLETGTAVWVQSVQDWFWYDTTSAAVADGITIVSPASGSGRWIRIVARSIPWSTQTAFFVDPTNGNDENDGTVQAQVAGTLQGPIKTMGELSRRVSGGLWKGSTVTVLGSTPSSDVFTAEVLTDSTATVTIRGVETTVTTGTISAVTAKNRATNQALQIADGALNWTPYVGKQIVITASANPNNVGARAWIAKNVGGGVARVTTFCTVGSAVPTERTPQAGDVYAVVSVPRLHIGTLVVSNEGNASVGSIAMVLDKLELAGLFGNVVSEVASGVGITNCEFIGSQAFAVSGTMYVYGQNNKYDNLIVRGSVLYVFAGLVVDQFDVYPANGLLIMDYDVMAQGAALFVTQGPGAHVQLVRVCVFDGSIAFRLTNGGVCVGAPMFNQDAIWGSGNAAGPRMDPGSSLLLNNTPTIANNTGTSDFTLGGTKTSVFRINPADGTPGSSVALTWANWAQTYAGGGFQKAAVDTFTNSSCITR